MNLESKGLATFAPSWLFPNGVRCGVCLFRLTAQVGQGTAEAAEIVEDIVQRGVQHTAAYDAYDTVSFHHILIGVGQHRIS